MRNRIEILEKANESLIHERAMQRKYEKELHRRFHHHGNYLRSNGAPIDMLMKFLCDKTYTIPINPEITH